MDRGKYICLEGGDGTGKSTLAEALFRRIEGSAKLRFPSDGQVGTMIRDGLMGIRLINEKSYLYLFAADGLQEETEIQELLGEGRDVICDRHPTLSGRVFQPKHHPMEHIESVYNSAAVDGISMPDYLFVLDLSVEESLARMTAREKYKDVVFEEDDLDKLKALRERYRDIAYRFSGILLDARKSTDDLVTEILGAIER